MLYYYIPHKHNVKLLYIYSIIRKSNQWQLLTVTTLYSYMMYKLYHGNQAYCDEIGNCQVCYMSQHYAKSI